MSHTLVNLADKYGGQVRVDTCTIGLRPCRRVDVDMPTSEVLPASFPRHVSDKNCDEAAN